MFMLGVQMASPPKQGLKLRGRAPVRHRRRGPNGLSTKTRIETSVLAGISPGPPSPNGLSTKTRIETSASRHVLSSCIRVQMASPPKQGLKPVQGNGLRRRLSRPNGLSTKTRIETDLLRADRIFFDSVQMASPPKQGLKPSSIHAKPNEIIVQMASPPKQGLKQCKERMYTCPRCGSKWPLHQNKD